MLKRSPGAMVLILVAVVTIAAWSRLRYTDRDGYDSPWRWKIDEDSSLQESARKAS